MIDATLQRVQKTDFKRPPQTMDAGTGQASGGFTLIEMMMIILIIGILAVAIGPRFFSVDGYQQRFYVEELTAALRYARRTAEASNCAVRVRLLANGYDLNQDANCFSGGSSLYTQPVVRPSDPDLPYASTDKPLSLSQNASRSTFFFQPDGKILDGAASISTVTVTLIGSELSTTLRLDGGSGYVSIL